MIRVLELLRTHITAAFCQTVFATVRTTERQRRWTLEALVQFWLAVILRGPRALSQTLYETLEGSEPLFLLVPATPEAFFQRCQTLRPAFFAEVFTRVTTRFLAVTPPRYAQDLGPLRARFATVVVVDGSRLAAIAHRLKLLWAERAVVLPGCLLVVYDMGRGLCRTLRYIRWQRGATVRAVLTNVLDPARRSPTEALALYPRRWTIERLFFDLKEVLNLHRVYAANPNAVAMRVYAAGCVYNAMRVAQGEVAAAAGLAPEAISPAKFFLKLAAACHCAALFELGFLDTQAANRGRRLRKPPVQQRRFARVPLDAILVEPRKGPRRKTPPLCGAETLEVLGACARR